MVARAIAQAASRRAAGDPYPAISALAALSPALDYPGGTIGQAYSLDEWLDCDCHEDSPERKQANMFERELVEERLDADDRLVAAITRGWVSRLNWLNGFRVRKCHTPS